MKALVNTGPGVVEWQDRPTPEPGAQQVRIRTATCGICATDLEMIAGWNRTGFGQIPGHEWSGTVDALGTGVDPALKGRTCVAENVLTDGGEVGFEHAGGYGQFFITEARNVHLLPAEFKLTTAALIEPLAVCVRALKRLRLENREKAIVLGDGNIGLLMLLLLKHADVRQVVVIGGRPVRLALAKELGASAVIDYHQVEGSLVKAALDAGGPFPNVAECSGNPAALAASLEMASMGGKVLVLGDYGDGKADFPWNRVLHRELELIGSNASAGAWGEAVRLATKRKLPLGKLVSRVMPASEGVKAIELVRESRDLMKVVLDWSQV